MRVWVRVCVCGVSGWECPRGATPVPHNYKYFLTLINTENMKNKRELFFLEVDISGPIRGMRTRDASTKPDLFEVKATIEKQFVEQIGRELWFANKSKSHP